MVGCLDIHPEKLCKLLLLSFKPGPPHLSHELLWVATAFITGRSVSRDPHSHLNAELPRQLGIVSLNICGRKGENKCIPLSSLLTPEWKEFRRKTNALCSRQLNPLSPYGLANRGPREERKCGPSACGHSWVHCACASPYGVVKALPKSDLKLTPV